MINLVSFGSNEEYLNLSNDVLKQMSSLYKNSRIKLYNSSDLPDDFLLKARSFPKGYGYFIWKPFIVKDTLEKMDESEILLYIDGRTGFVNKKNIFNFQNKILKISWLNKFIKNKNYDCAFWQMEKNIEKIWTTGDLFKKFNIKLESNEANDSQFSATFFCIRKNEKTIQFIDSWYQFLLNNYEICRDNISKEINSFDFIENRYDQSVLSLLLKTKFTSLNKLIIRDEEIYNKFSLVPHVKEHPKKF